MTMVYKLHKKNVFFLLLCVLGQNQVAFSMNFLSQAVNFTASQAVAGASAMLFEHPWVMLGAFALRDGSFSSLYDDWQKSHIVAVISGRMTQKNFTLFTNRSVSLIALLSMCGASFAEGRTATGLRFAGLLWSCSGAYVQYQKIPKSLKDSTESNHTRSSKDNNSRTEKQAINYDQLASNIKTSFLHFALPIVLQCMDLRTNVKI